MYTAEISRSNPSCILFLIDQSYSMADLFGGEIGGEGGKTKSHGVADAINRLLSNIVIRCTKAEGVRDYYDVGVIGYGPGVGPAFSGPLAGRELVPISEVADNPARVEERDRIVEIEDGAGGLAKKTEKLKLAIWFDPVAENGTPMCEALRQAHSLLTKWVDDHPDSYPPIVINLTDGEATDGDPGDPAKAIRQLATSDGNVLLFNCHISSGQASPIRYPSNEEGLPDKYARLLFGMSSVLPSGIREAAQSEGYELGSQARGFVFNAKLVEVIRFLDIGTRPSTLR
jgi:hypothetical protein